MQATNHVFLILPANFTYNMDTAASNSFQNKIKISPPEVSQMAIKEFHELVEKLKSKGVDVIVFNDTALPVKPDAIFPNNWISLHADGTIVLYPMLAANRRLERRPDIIESLKKRFKVTSIIDLSGHENENRFLEGTGSIVFDHQNKIAFACLSPRTDKNLLSELCEKLNYKPVYFYSHDQDGKEIYHTNVMMCIGDRFVVICLASISDLKERKFIIECFENTNHEIIDISFHQMNHFAGNMLMLKTKNNNSILALSQSAFDSLSNDQRKQLEKHSELLPLSIPTIEIIGGGSARCMIAEVFLPRL